MVKKKRSHHSAKSWVLDTLPLEKIVSIGVAVWILGLVSYLLLSDRSFDGPRIYFLKILLSLSCAIMVGTLPGFLKLDLSIPGVTVRAAGGVAAFIFVYSQAPNIPQLGLAPPEIKLNQLSGVDFRSLTDPAADPNFASSQMAVTAPVQVRNERQPSLTGSLQGSEITFNLNGQIYQFRWYYFVSLLPQPGGAWLTSESTLRRATVTDLPPGQQFDQEIMHLSETSPQWGNFVSAFKGLEGEFVVTLSITVSSGVLVQQCRIVPSRYRSKIEADEKAQRREIGYISTECEP